MLDRLTKCSQYETHNLLSQNRILFQNLDLVSAGTLANSADPDQKQQNETSAQGLHCLLKLQEIKG